MMPADNYLACLSQHRPGFRSAMAAAACFALLATGCGSNGAYRTVSARGTIKYADGSLIPADRISLEFISQEPAKDAKTHARPGKSEVNVEDGSFVVSTYEFEDGLIRGKHKVTAASIKASGGYTKQIPGKYRGVRTTPLEINAEGGPIELLIEKP